MPGNRDYVKLAPKPRIYQALSCADNFTPLEIAQDFNTTVWSLTQRFKISSDVADHFKIPGQTVRGYRN